MRQWYFKGWTEWYWDFPCGVVALEKLRENTNKIQMFLKFEISAQTYETAERAKNSSKRADGRLLSVSQTTQESTSLC